MKQKVSFHSTYSYPLFNKASKVKHGGAEIQMSFIAKELAKNENIETFCFVGDFQQSKVEEYNNVKLIKTFNPGTQFIAIELVNVFLYFLKLIRYNPDVLITSGAGSLAGVLALYKVLFRKKLIYRVSSSIDIDKTWVRNNKLGFLFEFTFKKANKIVCQAAYQKKLLSENYGIEGVVIPNFHTINKKEITKEEQILFVGRCERLKKPDLFIELAKLNTKQKFVMICPPTSDLSFFTEIKKQANEVANLNFISKVPFSKIQTYFDKAKLFVNLSNFEGFPNTFIQAGVGNTPILSLSVNPDNFINNYNCGFVCDNNFETLNKKLKLILENEMLWQEKSKNVFAYVNQNHNLDINLMKYSDLIFSML